MSEDTNPENSPEEELSIGDLLRTEREKKEISKSRLAEIIKVRENVIDALENEDWDKLPARVFVKGFIRSYTISIGYDTKKALRLFDKSVPTGDEDSPVPLTDKRKKSRVMYYAVPVLIILIIALYLFTTRDKTDSNIEPDLAVSETSSLPAETSVEENVPEQIESDEKPMFGEARETTIEPEKKASIREKPPQVQVKKPEETEEENKPAEEVIAQGTVMEEKALQTSEVKPEEITQDETIMVEEEPEPETISDEPEGPVLTLSATVNLRTYVRIIVDDDPPKEFIFKPGANPDWTAKRGFEVKVGNAGGIEFVFNGEDIGTIGDMGRVRTVSFPDDFKTNWKEEE